jgi:hypothetical protein
MRARRGRRMGKNIDLLEFIPELLNKLSDFMLVGDYVHFELKIDNLTISFDAPVPAKPKADDAVSNVRGFGTGRFTER